MKRFTGWVILLLAVMTAACGLSDYITYPLSQRVTFSEGTGFVYYQDKDGFQTLEDYNGQVVNSGEYVFMKADYRLPLFTVIRESGLNTRGVLNAEGRELVPCQYAVIEMIDADWQVGLELVTTDSQDYDYKDNGKADTYYQISKADYYHNGELIGSVGRDVYDKYCKPYGDYMYINGKETGAGYALSKAHGLLEYTKSDYFLVMNEYAENGFHFGSGQRAFTAGCTLTPEEVSCPVRYDQNGDFIDLQGNVLSNGGSPYKEFSQVEKVGDYFVTRADNQKYGIADLTGTEIVPAVYDKISYSDQTKTLFENGYQLAAKDGRFCYLDPTGKEVYVSEIETPFNDIKGYLYNPSFVCLQVLGKTIVFTPTAGQLGETYDDVDYPKAGSPYLGVEKDGMHGVIDMQGEYVIPLGRHWPQASVDGYTFFDSGNPDNERYYELYHFAKASEAQPEQETAGVLTEKAEEQAAPEPAATEPEAAEPEAAKPETEAPAAEQTEGQLRGAEAPAAEQDSTAWKCTECGAENDGKFCTNCGTPKPQPALKFCPNCGWKIPEGMNPKFCSECGTKL